MTVAGAGGGSDAGPLWLRLLIALAPPVLAAIIAGYFALSNTVNRRAERLKNLNDIRVSNAPERINPEYVLERIMLRELKALDRATTPVLKWENRFYALGTVIAGLVYTAFALVLLRVIHMSLPDRKIVFVIIAVVSVIFVVLIEIDLRVLKTSEAGAAMDERYERGLLALDERAARVEKPAGEDERENAPRSDPGAEVPNKDQQVPNRTTSPQDRNLPD